MEPEEASDVRALLKYPDDSAGGLMTTDYVAASRRGSPSQEAIDYVRKVGEEPETIYYCYVVEDGASAGRGDLAARPDHLGAHGSGSTTSWCTT